jgi:hypothetical protein
MSNSYKWALYNCDILPLKAPYRSTVFGLTPKTSENKSLIIVLFDNTPAELSSENRLGDLQQDRRKERYLVGDKRYKRSAMRTNNRKRTALATFDMVRSAVYRKGQLQ